MWLVRPGNGTYIKKSNKILRWAAQKLMPFRDLFLVKNLIQNEWEVPFVSLNQWSRSASYVKPVTISIGIFFWLMRMKRISQGNHTALSSQNNC